MALSSKWTRKPWHPGSVAVYQVKDFPLRVSSAEINLYDGTQLNIQLSQWFVSVSTLFCNPRYFLTTSLAQAHYSGPNDKLLSHYLSLEKSLIRPGFLGLTVIGLMGFHPICFIFWRKEAFYWLWYYLGNAPQNGESLERKDRCISRRGIRLDRLYSWSKTNFLHKLKGILPLLFLCFASSVKQISIP